MSQPDFLAALNEYWGTVGTVADVISPELYFAEIPPGGVWPDGSYYPVVVVTLVAGRVGGLNTGPGYWEDHFYQFSCYHPDADQAAVNGELAIAAIDPLLRTALTFTNGYKMTFYRQGHTFGKVRGMGPLSNTFIYGMTYTYKARVGRTR